MAKRTMTNEEKIQHMTRFSNYGALKQVFIMEGLRKYAEMCMAVEPEKLSNGFISGETWQRVAGEVFKEMETDMTIEDRDIDDDELAYV